MPRPFNREQLLGRNQVNGCEFAALIDFDIEFKPVAFIEAAQPSALDRGDVNEGVGLAIVALDKAETLHRIEELDGASRLFTGQLALRATSAATIAAKAAPVRTRFARTIFDRHRLAFDLEFGRGYLAATIDQREAERLALGQARQASLFNCGNVHEHIFAAIIAHDEAEALLTVEKFDDAGAFAHDLGRHRGTGCPTAAKSAAAATEAVPTATEAVTAAETIAARCGISTIALVAEAVALVPAAPAAIAATPSIKTHALYDFPEFIARKSLEPKHRTMVHMVFGAEPLRTFESQ
jgi:hypothetical protein